MTATICVTSGCGGIPSARSRKGYCSTCAKNARAAWSAMIADKTSEREDRDAGFLTLFLRADAAGRAAADATRPRAMIVEQHADVTDDSSPVSQSWYVPDGVCGFAWVSVRPGTSAFARWLVRHGVGTADRYAGGVTVWIRDYRQSYELKSAHAHAMAEVLRAAGFKATAHDRLD